MAEEEGKGGAAVKGGKSKIVIVLVIVNLLAVGGIGAYMALFRAHPAAAAPHAAEAAKPATHFGPLIELRPLIANLKDPGGDHYVKATIHLEVEAEKDVEPVNVAMVPIRNRFLAYFSDITSEQTVGSERKAAMRTALKAAANEVLGTAKIKNVYFAEFVVQ